MPHVFSEIASRVIEFIGITVIIPGVVKDYLIPGHLRLPDEEKRGGG